MYGSIDTDDITQWTAGVDWVTMTWKDDSDEGAYQVIRAVAAMAAEETNAGSSAGEYCQVLGYKGIRYAGAFAGVLRGQGAILTASGAHAHWVCAKGGLDPDSVARIDVQVTAWSVRDVGTLPRQVAQKSVAARVGVQHRPWQVNLIEGFGDGDTAYLGSRHSDLYCRCYDKGREDGDPFYHQALRYEIECKRDWAMRAYTHLLGREFARFECFNVVARAYGARGVELPAIRPLGAPIAPPRDDVADRVERKLAWFQKQVSPSVSELLTQGVPRATILAKLGL